MSKDDDLLQEIRENRTSAESEWDEVRKEAKTDKLCVSGQPWAALDPEALKARKDAKRPYLALDELGQYINQTVNDIRANPRGIRYAPTGNGANDKGAEFYQNHTREIEYRSDASIADARAFEDCVTSSYGWIEIATEREHARTFNQDIWIKPVVNADQVLSDPNSVWPDSRDMKFLYRSEPWSNAEFKRRFPKAKGAKFSNELAKQAPGWLNSKTTQVADYWRIDTYTRQLVAYQHPGEPEPQTALLDELPDGKLPEGADNIRQEDVDDTRVKCWITNGLDILEERKWKGRYIPYVSCFGKILYVDEGSGSKRKILSMTRLARDPYMLYCYIRTCEAEAIGGVPRATWVGYEGSFAKPDRWIKANHEPVAFLEGKVNVQGMPPGTPLPLPTKVPWDPPLQNLEIAAEAARRAIQAAMGITPLPTPMQQDNQKLSGKGMDKLDSSSQRGSFHFKDSYKLMIRRRGVIIEDLMDKILDARRDVAVREHDDSSIIVRINDPSGVGPDGKPQDPIFTKGDYRVTVSEGPATESQRVEAQEFVSGLMQNLQAIAQMAGPHVALKIFAKSIKLKQLGPIGDEIIELLDPPQMGQDGKPIPPEMAKLMAESKQLQQMLQQAQQEKQGKVIEQQGKLEIVKTQEQHEDQRSAADREVKLAVAELSARVDRMALLIEESQLVGARAHEAGQAARDRVHQAIENTKDRAHERIASDVAHAQALDAADQGQAHALEAGQQAAALAPTPDPGAGA